MPLLYLLPPLLLLFLRPATPLTFNYTRFDGVHSSCGCTAGSNAVCLAGEATLGSGSVIQLTKNQPGNDGSYSVGWAFHSDPLRLWSTAAGRSRRALASFTTRFSFNISKTTTTDQADGMAFFLFPYPFAQPPYNGGGYLGLVSHLNSSAPTAPGDNRFVAVELDTFQNSQWDLAAAPHVGIDVNSIASVTTQGLTGSAGPSLLQGQAKVDYDGATKTLNVSVVYNGGLRATLSHRVDLSAVLLASAVIGISGATGGASELNQLISWSFNSSLA